MTAPQKRAELVLDHIVIGCASLAQGVAWARAQLGIAVPQGGQHPRLGTHNCLMRIGEGFFLELIAIDPEAPAPPRPRWFGLDDPRQQARISERPCVLAWVCGTPDIAAALATAPELGAAVEMTRGDLLWHISLRDDGALAEGGTLPQLIEWRGGSPAARIPDLGVRLDRLTLRHPQPALLAGKLDEMGASHLASVNVSSGEAEIAVTLVTPHGERVTLR
jgi:hypothetical protein